MLEASWNADGGKETIDGISAVGCGLKAVVTPTSPQVLRRAVTCIAHYFRREITNGMLQYSSSEEDDDGHRAYLWANEGCLHNGKITVFGACCFRLRQWPHPLPEGFPEESYALQWLWLHPYERRKGHLSKAWPYFLARFDPFVPEGPFSPGMDAFLRKHNYHPEQRWPEVRRDWRYARLRSRMFGFKG